MENVSEGQSLLPSHRNLRIFCNIQIVIEFQPYKTLVLNLLFPDLKFISLYLKDYKLSVTSPTDAKGLL